MHNVAHNLVRDAVYITAEEEARLRPTLELRGLVPGTRQRPADVHLPAHVPHGLQPPPVQLQPPPQQPPPQQPAQQPAGGDSAAAAAGDVEAGAQAGDQAGARGGAQGGAEAGAPAAGAAAGWACLDIVRVGTHAPSWEQLGPQRALQEAHRRKARRPPPEGHFIVPIAFTTGGSFYEPTLRRAMSHWGALRLAEADAAGDDRLTAS